MGQNHIKAVHGRFDGEGMNRYKKPEMKRALVLRIISIVMTAALGIVIIAAMVRSGGSSKPVEEVSASPVSLFQNDRSSKGTERLFKKYYGLNAADYDGVIIWLPKSNVDSEELLIVKLKDEAQSDELLNAIEDRLSSQKNIFEGYKPEQYDMCRKAVITHKGNYILYVVHPDAEAINAAFKKSL